MASLVSLDCIVCSGRIEPGLARNLSLTCMNCRGSLPRAAAAVSSDATPDVAGTLPPAAAHGNEFTDTVGGRPSEAALERTLSTPGHEPGEAAPTAFFHVAGLRFHGRRAA